MRDAISQNIIKEEKVINFLTDAILKEMVILFFSVYQN